MKLGLRAYMLLRQRTISCGDALRQRKRVEAKGSEVWGRDQETPRKPMEEKSCFSRFVHTDSA